MTTSIESGEMGTAMTDRRDSLDFKRFNVPRVSDSWWVDATALLLTFFKKGRTVDEVVAWGRQQRISDCMIRHMLAWLSFNNVVRYDEEIELWKKSFRS